VAYFASVIRPMLAVSTMAKSSGEIGETDKTEFLGNARRRRDQIRSAHAPAFRSTHATFKS
jgi:hypothetical protein